MTKRTSSDAELDSINERNAIRVTSINDCAMSATHSAASEATALPRVRRLLLALVDYNEQNALLWLWSG